MKHHQLRSLFHQQVRAFNLTEFAIVLGVIASVLGVVWTAASMGWEMARREQAVEAVSTTVDSMRTFYQGQLGVPYAAITTMMPNLFNQRVIPYSMERKSRATCSNTGNLCADTPWGGSKGGAVDANGTFQVCSWNYSVTQTSCTTGSASTNPFFGVELKGLARDSCIKLTSQISGSTTISGLRGVLVNATALTPPISVAGATTNCVDANTNDIVFIYSLTGS